ncbi:hypothetical protein BsIDN1_62200 [Bacillus safensis]|uniref:Flagellar hook-associated protein 2 C-terminal domain-containing protein n=1 Tax=Bacillus safensis TaxID=561879 RepID=A0A5S9MIY0_BACIA|nr:hypothetical protein BsIDN1_62200 [Bacillus safensis]
MSEKEIELWETTAKSGLLRSDSILRSGASKIRSDLYANITTSDANKIQLTQIGISTSSSYKDGGKKLEFIKDSDGVEKLKKSH